MVLATGWWPAFDPFWCGTSMPSSNRFLNWLAAFKPDPFTLRRREWLRASVGALLGLLVTTGLCLKLFGPAVALALVGPLGASAVLLFGVSSGALSQPWSIIGSYLTAALVAVGVLQFGEHTLTFASLATGIALLLMYPLRCLHPPGGAVAFGVVLAGPAVAELGFAVVLPVGLNAVCLMACALLYNNLTRVRYPRPHVPAPALHLTRDPSPQVRVGITSDDLDHALRDFGEFVDVTREDLEEIIRRTEKHALRRSMGELRAEHIMSRDLRCCRPDSSLDQAWRIFSKHRLRIMPIIDEQRRVVGIVSLVDLMRHGRRRRRLRLLGRASAREPLRMQQVMSHPVQCVDVASPVADMIPLLSGMGLHCLPVLEHGKLVGMITQTDLIAALHRNLLVQSGA
jgi:CBS domain-containing membrane protein